VGDSFGDDYEGATAAGLPAVLLDREGRHGGLQGVSRIGSLDLLGRV
jgi:FMN phosphatase YigB (HAD superfamily)